jgi:hypothetical protein
MSNVKYHLDFIVNFLQSRNATAETLGHAEALYEHLKTHEQIVEQNVKLREDNSTLRKENANFRKENQALSLSILAAGGKK